MKQSIKELADELAKKIGPVSTLVGRTEIITNWLKAKLSEVDKKIEDDDEINDVAMEIIEQILE